MQPKMTRPRSTPILITLLLGVLAGLVLAMTQPAPPAEVSNSQSLSLSPVSNLQSPLPGVQETATQTVQLPLVMRNWSPAATSPASVVLGTEFAPFEEEDAGRFAEIVEQDLPLVKRAGFTSIRTHIYWREIEPTNTEPESFDWTRYDERLQDYGSYDLDPILGVVGYPEWATEYACGGGLLAGMAPEWREFVRAAAEHYSQPPFNVHIWEIGNEVDGEVEVDPTESPDDRLGEPTWPFGGCWGDIPAQYAEFLRIAYEEIKAVNPTATVMLGGLAHTEFDRWFIEDFFDQFLAAGGGAYTDVVGFHWFKPFQPNWPTAAAKARELRDIMAEYGVEKPMWLTEAYMPDRMLDTDTTAQRYEFITQEIPRTLGTGDIERLYWFGFSDWPEGYSDIDRGLVTRDHQPKPGLKTFEIMAEFVNGIPTQVDLPGVEAYRFHEPETGEQNWVLWADPDGPDAAPQTVTIPVFGTSATAVRIEMGDSYASTRPVLIDVNVDEEGVHIPVGREAVFVRIQR